MNDEVPLNEEERAGQAITAGPFTVTPLTRTRCQAHGTGHGIYAYGETRVVAVLVQRGNEHWRLDISEGPQEVP